MACATSKATTSTHSHGFFGNAFVPNVSTPSESRDQRIGLEEDCQLEEEKAILSGYNERIYFADTIRD